MINITGCQHVRQLLGVYVLGAIDPAERAEVDAHLASCPDCREELAGLAGLPALLSHVPIDEAARIAGFDENERLAPGQDIHETDGASDTLSPLLARMAQRRRVNRWRNLTAVAAAVVIAAGAAIGAVGLTGSTPPKPVAVGHPVGHWEQAQGTNPATQAHVVVRYEGRSWGTILDAAVSGIPAGTTCEFWVLGSHGHKWAAGGWTVTDPYELSSYPASSSAPASAVRGFEITSGHHVLVRATTS